ncbi:MAG TPA: hypothetical protein VMT62_01020 [Syntrophorhabdaceae bacterium]|nr:hypothetical protein [Syntrophorhabdaceae bacterium]
MERNTKKPITKVSSAVQKKAATIPDMQPVKPGSSNKQPGTQGSQSGGSTEKPKK